MGMTRHRVSRAESANFHIKTLIPHLKSSEFYTSHSANRAFTSLLSLSQTETFFNFQYISASIVMKLSSAIVSLLLLSFTSAVAVPDPLRIELDVNIPEGGQSNGEQTSLAVMMSHENGNNQKSLDDFQPPIPSKFC